jgi:hypothetical protein
MKIFENMKRRNERNTERLAKALWRAMAASVMKYNGHRNVKAYHQWQYVAMAAK